jgi:flagellar hook protein FlgE
VQLRWAKVDGTAGAEKWNLFYLENSSATNNTPAWRNVGTPFTFGGDGRMTAPATNSATVTGLSVDNTQVGTVNFGFPNLTQYASPSGLVQASTIQQNGYSSGTLESVAVTADGRISGTYSNGRVVPVALVSIAQFNGDNALKRRDGGVFEQTLESGPPIIGLNGSSIIGGNVEGSNTDIAEEFSKMIVTQQAYSANTRVVSTSQQMLSDVLNMIR